MEPVKLLALDLDGTLLNSQKELTLRTRDALYAAAGAGVEIVPTRIKPSARRKSRWKRHCGSWSISTASP